MSTCKSTFIPGSKGARLIRLVSDSHPLWSSARKIFEKQSESSVNHWTSLTRYVRYFDDCREVGVGALS